MMSEAIFLKGVGIFLISLVRFSGFFINIPVFGESMIPMRIKAGLSALCAFIILPHLMRTQTVPQLSIPGYGLIIFQEMVLGFGMGFMVLIAIDALKLAGQIIGMQIGFSFVQVADPSSNKSQGVIAQFFQLTGVLMFLIIGGHLMVLQTFYQSFELVPLGDISLSGSIVHQVANYTNMIFICGLQIAMPIIGVILCGDVALGIVARTVPKMNIFQVGFTIKILAGLTVVTILLPYLGDVVKQLIIISMGQINTFLNNV